MAEVLTNKGPKEDKDWFSSNGTLGQVSDTLGKIQGAQSSNAMDRAISIVGIIQKIMAALG